MGAAAQSLFATLFPSDCRLCKAPLVRISRLPVCEECLQRIPPIGGQTCAVCGERLFSPHFSSAAEAVCGLCQRTGPPFVKAAAYGSYDGELRGLIHLLKYDHIRPAAGVLGSMLAEVVEPLGGGLTSALVVPVPLHASKLRQRGFNQAEEIARAALKHLSDGRLGLNTTALRRVRATESQTGLTPHQRRENVRGAFVVKAAQEIAERQVLLVDDVFTTGTTVSECARVLRRAGAARVLVATVARVLKAESMQAASPEEGPEETAMRPSA